MQAATGNLKRVALELGGKSPVLIYTTLTPIPQSWMAAMGIFIHSGQGCISGSRIFAQRKVYDRVLEGTAGLATARWAALTRLTP